MADILEKVRQIIADYMGWEKEEITMNSNFRDDLGADEIDFIEIFQAIKEGFGIDIPEFEAEKWDTVGNAVDYLKSNI